VITARDDLVGAIRANLERLSPAERRVAGVVLAKPDAVIYMTLADVAAEARVSEPTVIRFSRTSGCDGFQSLKIRLAQSLGPGFAYADLDIGADDTAEAYATKVFIATMDNLARVRQRLDATALEAAVQAIARAGRLAFFGLGASGAVALDAYHKFFRLVGSCAAYTDSHMQHMAASVLAPGDVVVAISHTGRARELLESVPVARAAGATVAAITAPGSPLAQRSSIVLGVEVPEDTDVHTPMISRIAHLLIIDTLAVGVARQGGPATAERLQRLKASLQAKRTPKVGQW
jgi:RpiR family transcriptional regulator, carbohydrate utilization regulator